MQSNGNFLQEPMVSSFKKPMSGFTRYCTTDSCELSVESVRDCVKFLLSVYFGQCGGTYISLYNRDTSKRVYQSREYSLNSLKRTQKSRSEQGISLKKPERNTKKSLRAGNSPIISLKRAHKAFQSRKYPYN